MTMTTFPHGINSYVRCRSCNAPTDGAGTCINAACGRTVHDRRSTWAFAIAAALTVGWFAFVASPAGDNTAVEAQTMEQPK